MTEAFKSTITWLLVGTVGVFVAMNWATASFTGYEYLPAGNDSFYHARRILDTYANPSSFFEFDSRIHVPEGSWIAWPWLYDYSMARALRLLAPPSSGIDPMAALVYIPAVWAYVTIGLVLAIAATLRLPRPLQVIAGLTAALLPLNQILHGVGRVDHHFMEYSFVLLALLGSLRWFDRPDHSGRAAFVGLCLGIAPGFHNALFILQLPMLGALFLSWIRCGPMPRLPTVSFCAALLGGCLLVVVPSQPFLKGWFSYYLLSTFHLYIAACTAVVALFLASGPFSARRLAALVALGVAMLVPILGQLSLVSDFFAHRVERLSGIVEARSLPTMLGEIGGARQVAVKYSCLAFLVPFVAVGLGYWLVRTRKRMNIPFIVFALFGLILLVQQYRMHYFGSFALSLPILVAAAELARRRPARRMAVHGACALLFAGAFFPPIEARVSASLQPGLDGHYQLVGPLMPELEQLCREKPGTVLVWNDAGHYVRFHTECSVIANNFLLTPQHSDKVREVDAIAAMSLEQALAARPDLDYLLIYYTKIWKSFPDGSRELMEPGEMADYADGTPLFRELLTAPDPTALPGLEFVTQVLVKTDAGDRVLARLFAVKAGGGHAPAARPEVQRRTGWKHGNKGLG